jgi:predicted enzyme related to lactoylglutathione lyase
MPRAAKWDISYGMPTKRKKPTTIAKSSRPKTAKRGQAAKPAKARPLAKPARLVKPAPRRQTARRRTTKPQTVEAMFQKVAFTMFSVTDATRARSFYEDVLGLKRGLAAPNGVWTEYDLPGGGCLALFCHPNPAFARPPGGASIAFEVADLDALNRRLLAAGVSYQGDVVHGPRCRMSNILDSEGNGIILHQLSPQKP